MLLVVFLIACAVAGAQQSGGTGVISGTVVDAASGDPVRKAIIRLTWQGTPQAWALVRSDSSGRFRFEGLPAGKYTLRATKAGIGTANYGANSSRELGAPIQLADGQVREELILRFIHSGSVSGRVLDSDGDPVAGTSVTLLRMSRNMGDRVAVNYRSASTNDRGEYRVPNVDPGEYYPVVQSATAGAPARQFFGGSREFKDATPIALRGGESLTGIDFHVVPESLVHVHGRVTGVPSPPQDPHQVFGFPVGIRPAEPGPFRWEQQTAAKAPEFGFDFMQVPSGRYRVETRVPSASADGKSHPYFASQIIDVHEGMGDVLLDVLPAGSLKGQVRIEGKGAPPVTSLRIALGTRSASPSRPNHSVQPVADGSFIIDELAAGEWGLNVAPLPPGAFLKSAILGEKDVRFGWFEVPRSEAVLKIVVSMNSATVEGEVDAAGADSARGGILLAAVGPLHNLLRFYYSTPAGDDGKFKFTGIAPGKYKVFALEKLAAMNFRNPEAADNLDSLGTEIDVPEGAAVKVRPRLIPIDRARQALP